MTWEWKDFVALWGAVLSTVLLIVKLRDNCPVIFWRPSDKDRVMTLTLVIKNPSHKPLQIFAAKFVRTGKDQLGLSGTRTDGSNESGSHAESRFQGNFHLYVPPQESREIVVDRIQDENQRGWLILKWHRYDSVLQFPICLRIRGRFVQHSFGSLAEE